MQLTDSRGTAFLISTKSVVYVREWGDGARLLLSRGNQVIDVAETVAEVITASDSVLVAFTSLSGDATGSVAINPLYIVSVSSYSSGTQSQIVLLDDNNNTTRFVMTVSTAFASMDAIIEAGDSGAQPLDADLTTIAGLSPSNDDFLQRKAGAWANRTAAQVKTDLGVPTYARYVALLTQTGTDAPVATVLENTLGGTVVWTRDDVGTYLGTLAGVFIESKTFVIIGSSGGQNGAFRIATDVVIVSTLDNSGVATDELLSGTGIEIRVYP